ncbi:MAG: protein-disulfide reductase DsbD family protein [Rickettsiales bacterium]
MHARICSLFLVLLCLLVSFKANAAYEGQPVQIQVATARLVAEHDAFIPGEPFFVALHLSLPEGWHTYWQNPGDSGLPTEITWSLPTGVTAGKIHWPVPERVEWQGIVNYGYSKDAYLLVPITADKNFEGDALLTAHANWLVCKDICIPESADVSIRLRANPDFSPLPDSLFESLIEELPKPYTTEVYYGMDDKHIFIALPENMTRFLKDPNDIEFFPLTTGLTSNAKPPKIVQGDHNYLVFERGGVQDPARLKGVIKVGEDAWKINAAYDHSLHLAEETAGKKEASSESATFLTAILFALLGGIILNAMPCVFPILSLKVIKLISYANHSRGVAARHGFAYTAGILISFLIVAGTLAALKHTGLEIGWGFQLQSPFFVTSMIFLLFLVGLNLSGIFNLPSIGGLLGHKKASEDNYAGSFFTGVLATLVATPCTAPFMATALGFALTQSLPVSFIIFLALGFGMALPYLAVSLIPALANHLPKPGPWMERLRQFLAFPIYATLVWLLWVLTLQSGPSGVAAALSGLVVLALIVWILGLNIGWAKRLAVTACLLIVLVYTLFTSRGDYTYDTMQDISVAPYSEKILNSLLANKQPVFVNATAAWCLTCKVNETVALSSPKVHEHFKKMNVSVLVADWTKADPEVTKFLETHQRQGVPLYVYYAADGSQTVLPQLLTPSIIINTIK